MAEKLTMEQIEQKAAELSETYKAKVHSLVFVEPSTEEQIIGFIKEPSRMVKYRVMDKGLTSPATAAAELLEAVLIKEESDKRIYSEASEDDKYNMGAAMACYQLINVSVNTFKKN